MSKFFGKNDVSSSEEEDSDSDEKEQKQQEQKKNTTNKGGKIKLGDSDESSEEEERVVKTTAQKREDNLRDAFAKMKNHIKTNDFISIQGDFETIQEEMEKCMGSIFATDKLQTLPSWVLKNLIVLEDAVLEVTNEQKKKMNKQNSQAFAKVKQKLRKYLTESGDDENKFEAQVKKFRENPVDDEADKKKEGKKGAKKKDSDDSDDSDDSSDESSSDEDSDEKKPAPKKEEKKKEAKKDSSSDDSDSSSSDSSSSSSDSDSNKNSESEPDEPESEFVDGTKIPKKYEFLLLDRAQMTPEQRRWKWVRFDALPDDLKPHIAGPSKQAADDDRLCTNGHVMEFHLTYTPNDNEESLTCNKCQKTIGEKEAIYVCEECSQYQHKNCKKNINPGKKVQSDDDEATLIERDQDRDYTIQDNVDTIITKFRGQETSRKNFNVAEQIEVLNIMFAQQVEAKTDNKINILMILIATYFTAAKKSVEGYFDRYTWLKSNEIITQLLDILKKKESDTLKSNDTEKIEEFKRNNKQIFPALVNYMDKLQSQLHKAFQNLDQAKIEYLHRIRDECLLLKQCDVIMQYFIQNNEEQKAAKIAILKLEHIYYKNDSVYTKTREALKNQPKKLEAVYFLSKPSTEEISYLVQLVVTHLGNKSKVQATLLQCFHHAIHNRYFDAKNLLMNTHISESIHKQPIQLQVIYNRTIVQIGLCAFRTGLFAESNQVLGDIYTSPKIKESLAQGSSGFYRQQQEKTLEEEIEEKRRFTPPHLQINLEYVEVVYMTTSMLLEIPNISENKFTVQRDVISRNFRKLIEQYDQKGMQFVPQTSRDKIVEAARALHKSDWVDAFKRISTITMFARLEEFQKGQLKEQLLSAFKDAALKIFVIESESQYESFSITNVCQQFEITKETLIKQVSKLIVKDTISGRIDLASNSVIFNKQSQSALSSENRAEMDYLQSVNLDKIRQLVDSNDRCMELLVNQHNYIQYNQSKQDKGDKPAAGGATGKR